MSTMGTGEAITFGEGVALPTRIKFDMLAADEMPKSNTASFTTNWARDMPDDSFLNEVVNRWRAQTFNPDSANYAVEAAPVAPAPVAAPNHSSIRREALQPAPVQQRPGIQPAPAPFGQHVPPTRQSADPGQPAPAPASNQQPSLANLIKQFRT